MCSNRKTALLVGWRCAPTLVTSIPGPGAQRVTRP